MPPLDQHGNAEPLKGGAGGSHGNGRLKGPVQIFHLDIASINAAFAELFDDRDNEMGLRGRHETFDRLRVDDPEEVQDALTQGSSGITASEERSRRYALLVSD